MARDEIDWELIQEGTRLLGIPLNTFHQWKYRGSVPHRWRLPLVQLGKVNPKAFVSSGRKMNSSRKEKR
jgi:hypothetical protein